MQYSICSYSFHRMLKDGKMDVFQYIDWNKEHGFDVLDPWNAHLQDGYDDDAWLATVKEHAAAAGLPFGCIAVDGAHIYEPTEEARAENRQRAYRWLDMAAFLGATQVRIDAGGPEEMPDDIFPIIVEGFQDLVKCAADRNIELVTENHWGPTKHADNAIKLLEAVDGLGLLFDTNNWAEGTAEDAWPKCAKYASLTHVKTFQFDEVGNDPSVDLEKAMNILVDAGYDGVWGIESCPVNGDEPTGVLKTRSLMQRVLE